MWATNFGSQTVFVNNTLSKTKAQVVRTPVKSEVIFHRPLAACTSQTALTTTSKPPFSARVLANFTSDLLASFDVFARTHQAQRWREIGDLNMDPSYLYPGKPTDEECPVPKNEYLSTENQQAYMQWIEKMLNLDRRASNDPRLYCGYCDMNNHPRFDASMLTSTRSRMRSIDAHCASLPSSILVFQSSDQWRQW